MSNSYKHTIRLPNTNFPMKANLKELDKKIQNKWHSEKTYNIIREQNKDKPKFILHDGPPYANGHIHLGTALNKILKDIIVKGKSLLGYNAPLVFGWDCHGLPIEWKVEENFKKEGKNKDGINPVEFRSECRKFANYWLNIQKEEFKKLGVIADFNNPYITMDYQAEALIYKEITKLIKNNYLYLGKKPIMWSVIEQTALAEAEVEYINKVSKALFIGFPVSQAPKELWINALAVIWTTTPWTIPGNQAIAFNPTIEYGLYQIVEVENDSLLRPSIKIIVAKELAEKLFSKFLVKKFTLLDTKVGLDNFKAQHPLYHNGFNQDVPLLEGNFVDTSVGSGLVHIAPAYGLDDFNLANKHNILPIDIITDNGVYKKTVPLFAGQHIFKVTNNVIDELKKSNMLIQEEQITHSYPCSWRSKAPLIYRLTPQWFLKLDYNNLRNNILSSLNKEINFLPKISKNRIYSMVSQRPDWCLSRQRLWGVPLAMFVNLETEELLQDEETYGNVYTAFLKEGSDAWFKGDPKRFLSPSIKADDYKPIFDVVDVWFDSGCSYVYVLKERSELSFPADMYLEGSDQHRGWFQSTLIEGMASYKEVPYKTVLTHGFVLDEKGQKMSKSVGNVINPLDVIDKYGLDILRLWVANSDYKEDVRAGDNIFKQQTDVYRKIRNTLRYMLGNLYYYKEEYKVNYYDLPELEKIVLHGIYTLQESFKRCFTETYEFHNFFNELYNFIAVDLSSFYFDIRKDALYCDSDKDINFKSCLTVMNILFDYMVKWLSPFITITAEEAFLEYPTDKNSILLETLREVPKSWFVPELFQKYEFIKEVRSVVFNVIEEARANKVIGSGLECEPIIYVNSEDAKLLQTVDFASICITSGVVIKVDNNITDSHSSKYNIKVIFAKKDGKKCNRCWKIGKINSNLLCDRCENVLTN